MSTKGIISFIGIVFFSILMSMSCQEEEPETVTILPIEKINGFIIDGEGTKLIASDQGLYYLNPQNNSFKKITTGLEPIPINDLALFSNENLTDLWLATPAGALNFNTLSLLTSSNSGLHNTVVDHLNFDHNSNSYFATPSGLSILNNDKWVLNLGVDSLYLKFDITDMASATDGNTYVTTNGGGVERFKMNVDGISGATIFNTDWTYLKSNNVLTVFIDDTVQAYGTDKGAAIHFSESTKWDWETYNTLTGLVNDTVLSITKDPSGNWWFGTAHGLSKFDGTQWTNFTIESHNIISNTIKFLALDTDGSLWFASDAGLSHFSNNQWTNYKY